jgi:SAM-dependent methyltransferase
MSQEPEDFIVRHRRRIPPGAEVLDVGCGKGRHALLLAREGCRVVAMDREDGVIETLRATAAVERLDLIAVQADVERMSLVPERFDAIVNTLFLCRPLFSQYVRALRPGGTLLFRTFTTDHIDLLGNAHPRREFLLERGELAGAFPELEVVDCDESVAGGRAMATLVASKPRL